MANVIPIRLGRGAPSWRSLQSEPFDAADGTLKCPACGGSTVHTPAVRTVGGPEMAERVRDGEFPFDGSVAPIVGTRGAQIEIGLHCEECGVAAVLALQFHKGSVFVRWKPIGRLEAEAPVDIWRD